MEPYLGLISLLFAIVLQAVAFIIWAAKMDSRVGNIEKLIGPLADGTVARLDERTQYIAKGVERLQTTVDKLTPAK